MGARVGMGEGPHGRGSGGLGGGPERLVVALPAGPGWRALMDRAASIASRSDGTELLAVHVARSEGASGTAGPGVLDRQRAAVEELGGSFHHVLGEDVTTAIMEFCHGVGATQLVVGSAPRAGRFGLRPGVGAGVAELADDLDVHLVVLPSHERESARGRRWARSRLGRRRWMTGWMLALAGPPLLAVVLAQERRHLALPTDLLLFLALTVAVALVGGLGPAMVAAVMGFLLLNWFFTQPFHTFTVARPENALALVVFVAVAVGVASVVDLAARRTAQAARAGAEAETLSLLATSVLRGQEALPALLQRVRETFGVGSASLLERGGGGEGWVVMGSIGPQACASPESADTLASVREDPAGEVVLALRGRVLQASDRRVLSAFAAQAAAALEWHRLAETAAQARRLAEGNKVRTALLAAVSHDLRTPLASIKAAISSLRQDDVDWAPDDRAELLATVEESADRLGGLIANLLDMSRLQTGVVAPLTRPVSVEEVLPPALLGVPADRLRVEVPETLPEVVADPGLLERALANVVENAVRHSRDPVVVAATEVRFGHGQGRVEIHVIDNGPGVSDAGKEEMFAPFQRLGDAPKGTGVGLGLAVARGLIEVMGGRLHAADTPGGGLTMVFSLPISTDADSAAAGGHDDEPDRAPGREKR